MLNKTNLEFILLDLGRVVINYRPELTYLQLFPDDLELVDFEKRYQAFVKSSFYSEFEKGQIDFLNFKEQTEKLFNLHLDINSFEKIWNACLPSEVDGIAKLIDEFSDRFTFCVLSNTNSVHLKHMMENFPVMNKFKNIFTSFELSKRKPDPEIYLEVLRVLKLEKAEKLLFIDDMQENLLAAKTLGLQVEQCNSSSEQMRDIIKSYI